MSLHRRAISFLAALLLLTVSWVGAPGRASATPTGGKLVTACRNNLAHNPKVAPPACRSVQNGLWQTSAACRTPLYAAPDPSAPEACAAVDGRPISDAEISAYQSTWVHRALTLQRGLDEAVPLTEALIPHTHNSFNASQYRVPTDGSLPRYYPTLTNQDSNQVYGITGQLDMDIRAIEIDLHWVPSPYGSPATNGYWVTLCHGNSQRAPVAAPGSDPAIVHVGCSADRPMQAGLQEVADWLAAHPDAFVVLYLENQLSGSPQAHEVAGQLIHQILGPYVIPTPPGARCAPMPMDKSRAELRSQGRVLIVGNCDAGGPTAWGTVVHERGPRWDESGDPDTYGAAACAADQAARRTDASFRRFFEDSTWLAAMVGSNRATSSLGGTSVITVAKTATMVRCGVNIIGFDQLTPQDPRLAALVWSWAPDQPSRSGACAEQRGDTHFVASGCTTPMPFACLAADGTWQVTKRVGAWSHGPRACATEFVGSHYAVPANGYRNSLLASAKRPGVADVWLNYATTSEGWTPNALGAVSHSGSLTGASPEGLASQHLHGTSSPQGTQDVRLHLTGAARPLAVRLRWILVAALFGLLAGAIMGLRRKLSSRDA